MLLNLPPFGVGVPALVEVARRMRSIMIACSRDGAGDGMREVTGGNSRTGLTIGVRGAGLAVRGIGARIEERVEFDLE